MLIFGLKILLYYLGYKQIAYISFAIIFIYIVFKYTGSDRRKNSRDCR